MTGSVPVEELENLRDHYDRGWVGDETQDFIDRLDVLIDRYQVEEPSGGNRSV